MTTPDPERDFILGVAVLALAIVAALFLYWPPAWGQEYPPDWTLIIRGHDGQQYGVPGLELPACAQMREQLATQRAGRGAICAQVNMAEQGILPYNPDDTAAARAIFTPAPKEPPPI